MKTIVLTLIAVLLIGFAAVLGFVYSGLYDVAASMPHGGFSAWLLHTTMEESVERRAEGLHVPALDDESLLLAGVSDFEAMCVGCHGAPDKEPGPVGQGLNPAAPDLAESARELRASELFWITKHGIRMTGMPAWSATHSDEELWPVVALMTALPDMDATAYAGLRGRAEGMGHHGGDTSGAGHDHGEESAGDDGGDGHGNDGDGGIESSVPESEAEHDHSTHEH